MIIKLDHKINIFKLQEYLEFVKKTCKPFMKKDGPWGGWSITSQNGDVYDGWQTGEKIHDSKADNDEIIKLKAFFTSSHFNKPTLLYTNYIIDLLKEIEIHVPNLELSRIRIAVLRPHMEQSAYWHKDGDANDSKNFRLHIPIITNNKCNFEYEDQKRHLPADGSIYLLDVSQTHRVTNLSNEDRYHLIADVKKSKN